MLTFSTITSTCSLYDSYIIFSICKIAFPWSPFSLAAASGRVAVTRMVMGWEDSKQKEQEVLRKIILPSSPVRVI